MIPSAPAAFALRQRSSTLTPRSNRAARKASSATSRPTRRLKLKQSAIREDVLGVYRFNPPTQPSGGDTDDANARIELFWGVIGLVSRLLGVSLEGLTVKVLAHKLARAYTHVGADADGRRWGTTAFQRTDRALLEGLAQYCTCRVLERLGKQAPGAMDAYEKLLPHQPEIYRTHLGWLERHSPEEVREAMLSIRCREAGSLAEFEWLLGESRTRRRNR